MADVDDNYVDEYEAICKAVMESAAEVLLDWELPFVSDIGHGLTWADAK
jgi:DNA polymerase I-like protein with 3'-5' exonuclease and polymerase domains